MFQGNQCVPDKGNVPSGSNCFKWHNLSQVILTVPINSMYPDEPRCSSLSNLLQMNQAIQVETLTYNAVACTEPCQTSNICNLSSKEIPAQAFSCEFYEFFNNTFFRTPPVAASIKISKSSQEKIMSPWTARLTVILFIYINKWILQLWNVGDIAIGGGGGIKGWIGGVVQSPYFQQISSRISLLGGSSNL